MSGRKTFGLFGSIEKKSKNEKSICKNIEIGKIKKHFLEKDFIIPEYQRDLDIDKVEEMYEKINKSIDNLIIFSNQVNPIQIATIQIEENKFNHIVIDGQHRLNALIKLPTKFNKILFTFHLQICNNEKEAIEKFKTCIKGNDTNYLIDSQLLNPYFKDSIPYKLKLLIQDELSEYFVNSKKNPYIYNLESFLIKLKNIGFFFKYKNKSVKQLYKLLIKRNNKFFNKKYLQYIKDNNYDVFYKKEIICIQNKRIFSLKNNNFIDYLNNVKIDKFHKFRKVKQTIPKKLKEFIWKTYCNNKNFDYNQNIECPITFCTNIISLNKFHCGHIISEANGGNLQVKNLQPLCANCNISMGKKNWKDYDILSIYI